MAVPLCRRTAIVVHMPYEYCRWYATLLQIQWSDPESTVHGMVISKNSQDMKSTNQGITAHAEKIGGYDLYSTYIGGYPWPSDTWNRTTVLFVSQTALLPFLFLLAPSASCFHPSMAFLTSEGVLAGPVGYYSLLGLGLLAVYYVVSAVQSWSRLRSVPGPWVATFSYAWLARVAVSGRQGPIYRDLNKQYGSSLVRVGPNELTTDDPELLRRMAGARSAYGRDGWYLGAQFNPYHPNMFTMLDVREHDRAKAKTAGAYGGRETPALVPGVDEQVATLLRVIREKYVVAAPTAGQGQGRLLDLAVMTSFFTMDVITKVAFGEEFGYMKTDEDLYGFLFSIRKFCPAWP